MCLCCPRLYLSAKYVYGSQVDTRGTISTIIMETSKNSSHETTSTPLLPISDLISSDISNTASDISTKVDLAVADGLQKAKGKENDRVTSIIRGELEQLTQTQAKNNEEIKKKASELQSLRENNLVVAGAVSGLRKVLDGVLRK